MTNANDYFGSSIGSENFYQSKRSDILYTDGVKDMADSCGAYWLIDVVISHQTNRAIKFEPFQVWELKRHSEGTFFVRATNGNKRVIITQHIPFSDFKYDIATLWLVNGCILLPKEY